MREKSTKRGIYTNRQPTHLEETVEQVYSSEIKTHTHAPNLHGRPVYRSTLLGCKSKGRLKGGPRGEARSKAGVSSARQWWPDLPRVEGSEATWDDARGRQWERSRAA